ncbi:MULTISPECIES: LysR family transcriptional regulator [Solibacillus]|uniref:LysR family transcriptional regulator n=1 Tax=Solibacillus merdavium TaxID=2762218 RepID=A0ABR8XMP7_9BACL|nr:LysR family transcriptional regulator [Solibacillus merdavium]MBD8033211.1 LysR family transcriptional regulator [Solibacillus merdavium]
MEFRQLEYFMMLCKELHFTRAAEKLHISQPTLSHQIKVLENEVGALLFDRIGKKISLTEAGEILFNQSASIFNSIDNAKLQINELELLERGTLKIGALPGELTNIVSESLIQYSFEYPQIKLSVLSSDDLYSLLRDNQIDFAFSFTQNYLPSAEDQFIEIPLYVEEFLFVAEREHPLMAEEELSLSQLIDVPLILFSSLHLCRKILDGTLKQEHISLNPVFETSSINTIFNFVNKGMGGTIIAKSLYQMQDNERLTARPITNEGLKRETAIIYRKDKFMNKAVRYYIPILIDYLEQLHILLSEQTKDQLYTVSAGK